MTLEDVANRLLLHILGDVDPTTLELSSEEEAVEAELKKGMSGNAKLSYWVSSFFEILCGYPSYGLCCVFALQVCFWVSPPLRCEAFIFPFSYQDFYWGKSAIGSYVLGTFVCLTRHPTER